MFILRETNFPLLDLKLKLPYICESCLSELNLEDNVDDVQLNLFDVEC